MPVNALPAEQEPAPLRATRAGTARDHRRHPLRNPRALVSTALRTKSVHAREILAELSWPGHTPAALEQWAREGAPWPEVRSDQEPAWLARYAQVLAVQLGDPHERHTARRVLEAVLAAEELSGRPQELLAQLRLVERDGPGVSALLGTRHLRAGAREALTADRLNPWLFPDGAAERWAPAFNAALHSRALADLRVLPGPVPGWPGADSPLDRLQGTDLPRLESPHRVTVLMSCFRPGPELETAVRAVLEQTWSNLELFLIDDASGPEYLPWLAEIAARDPRIRLIRKGVNGGTYRARNTALRVATGEFCTTLDSDDYLHPQAIELGMRRLLTEPGVLATRGQGVRVTPDLELTRPGYLPRMTAAGTLLFRRREVMDRIGWFDHTSKGADTEFAHRLVAAFGPVIEDLSESVLFLRDGDTLSSGEFSMGWRHGSRHAYKSAYRQWHQQIATGAADPFLDPALPRPFPEPLRWMKHPVPGTAQDHSVQVCFAGDWRRYGGPQRSMLEEIAACREAGFSVAVMHLEAFRFMTPKDLPLCQPVMDLIAAGTVEWLQPDDDVRVEVLVLRYPPILQYPPRLMREPVRVNQLLLVANQAPMERDGSDQRYVVADVTARARELFGVDPVWVPQGARVREVLRDQDPDAVLSDWDNPGLIDGGAWHCRDDRHPGADGTVVVGRYSRDDHIKFPATFAELLAGYSFPEGYQVRIMGGVRTLPALAGATDPDGNPDAAGLELPANWELLPQGAVPVRDFLAGLDFFLYLDNAAAHEAFGRVILEAAVSGVLTIVHPKHRVVFGDVVDYAEPGEAQALIARYVADPDAYRERVLRSRELVAERYGHAGFAERIRSLLAEPGPAGQDHLGQDLPAEPERLSVRPTGNPQSPVAVDTSPGKEVLSVRLRALSDGPRADQVVVVHPSGEQARAAAADWLRRTLVGGLAEGAGWVDAGTAPAEVRAVVMVREGTVRWSMRVPPLTPPRPGENWPADVGDAPGDGWWGSSWRLRSGVHGTLEDGPGSAQDLQPHTRQLAPRGSQGLAGR